LQGLGLVGSRLKHRGEPPHLHASPRKNEGTRRSRSLHVEKSPCCHNSPRRGHRSRRYRSPSPRRNNSPRHRGVSRRSRSPQYVYDNEDNKIEMGAPCFTHRIRRTPAPKGFKLPHEKQKYDRSHEPHSWLSDYLQVVKILGGSKEIAMQIL
jgi:hypothetical protein